MKRWKWLGIGLVLAVTAILAPQLLQPTWRSASTSVGPVDFVRYGANEHSNPVFSPQSSFTTAWTFHASMPLRMSSLANGTVYSVGMGTGWTGNPIGMLYAVGAAHGRLLWKRPLDNWAMTAPVVAHGIVFVGTGGPDFAPPYDTTVNTLASRHIIRGTGPNRIYAFDARTGREIWTVTTSGENMPTFLYHKGLLVVANGSGNVTAYQAATGRVMWQTAIGSYVSMSSPDLVGNLVVVAGAHPYRLYALNVDSGQIVWKAPLPGTIAGADDSSIAAGANQVFVVGTIGTWTRAQTRLYAFSLSGKPEWTLTEGAAPLPARIEVGAPTVSGNTVLFASPLSREEYAVDSATGHVIWQLPLKAPVKTSVAVVNGYAVIPTVKNQVLTVSMATGHVLKTTALSGKFVSFPIIVGHTVYITSESGELQAVPLTRLF